MARRRSAGPRPRTSSPTSPVAAKDPALPWCGSPSTPPSFPRSGLRSRAGEISLAQAGVIGGRVAALPRDPEYRDQVATALLTLVDNQGYDATDLDRCFTHVAKELDTDGLLLARSSPRTSKNAAPTVPGTSTSPRTTSGGGGSRATPASRKLELVKTTLMPPRRTDRDRARRLRRRPHHHRNDPVRRPRTPTPPRLPRPDVRPRRPRHPRPRRPDVGRTRRSLPPPPAHRQPAPRPRHLGPDHPHHELRGPPRPARRPRTPAHRRHACPPRWSAGWPATPN